MGVIEVTAEVRVERDAEEVFAYLTDMQNNPSWQKGMVSCRWTSEPPLRLGSTYDQVARFLGREIVSSFEVTELTDTTLRIQSTSGSMPLDITRSVRPAGPGACDVSAVVRGDPGPVFGFAGPLMRWMVGRSVRADYQRLKTLLEAPG